MAGGYEKVTYSSPLGRTVFRSIGKELYIIAHTPARLLSAASTGPSSLLQPDPILSSISALNPLDGRRHIYMKA